jgi:hypothetical protein
VQILLEVSDRVPMGEVEAALSSCGIIPMTKVAGKVLESSICFFH